MWPVVLAASLSLWCGCGTERYEEEMYKTIDKLRLANKFVDLSPNATIVVHPDTEAAVKVAIQLPKLFSGKPAMNRKTADPNYPDDLIPADRIEPLPVKIPGFQMTFEQIVTSNNGRRAMSVFFGVIPADPQILEKLPAEIKANLKVPADLYWKAEQVVRRDGSKVPWKSITVEAPQTFYWNNTGRSTPESMNGTFSIWVHESLGHYVFMAYRVPTTAVETKQLPDAFASAAGTIQVTPSGFPVSTAGAGGDAAGAPGDAVGGPPSAADGQAGAPGAAKP
jgi:hypothetical protein